ncbi:MAG: hypothetical protein JWO74_893 [Solirubrobacterales bacterium]|nr:hypothetical protein [Solirubrobacterales bacterium]
MQTGPRPGGTPSTWEPDYRQLIESAGDAIAALLRTLGHAEDDAEALLGRHFAEILTPQAAAVASRHFAEGVDGAADSPFFEVEAVRIDGVVINLRRQAIAFTDLVLRLTREPAAALGAPDLS